MSIEVDTRTRAATRNARILHAIIWAWSGYWMFTAGIPPAGAQSTLFRVSWGIAIALGYFVTWAALRDMMVQTFKWLDEVLDAFLALLRNKKGQ